MFEAKLVRKGKTDILHLRGELVIDTVSKLKGIMMKLEEGDGKTHSANPLVVDMSGLKFVDSYGVSFLVSLKFKLKGRRIALAGPNHHVRNVLVRLFVMDQFTVCKSVKGALRAVGGTASGIGGAV
ncbi:MAG: STAS domain-containing protein [bacterium]